jgi:hypothetical protein
LKEDQVRFAREDGRKHKTDFGRENPRSDGIWRCVSDLTRILGASGLPPPTRPRAHAYYGPQFARTGCDTYSGHHKQTPLWPAHVSAQQDQTRRDPSAQQDKTRAERPLRPAHRPAHSDLPQPRLSGPPGWVPFPTSTSQGANRENAISLSISRPQRVFIASQERAKTGQARYKRTQRK